MSRLPPTHIPATLACVRIICTRLVYPIASDKANGKDEIYPGDLVEFACGRQV
jgi:hypothetical protein